MNKAISNNKDLTPGEKAKTKNCSKWNFYSQKCKTCKYELICAEDWKLEDWFPLKKEAETKKSNTERKKIGFKEDIDTLISSLHIIKETDSYSQHHLEQIRTILKDTIKKILEIVQINR